MSLFLRLLEDEDKGAALASALRAVAAGEPDPRVFEADPDAFALVPGAPFAYWVGNGVRDVFGSALPFDRSFLAIRGAYTTDDFRFYRLAWEPSANVYAQTRQDSLGGKSFVGLAKGGAWSPYYCDVHLAVLWCDDGAEAKAHLSAYRERKGWGTDWSACLNGHGEYFRPGLTWPRRTTSGLSMRAMPAGCIFADKGPAAFVEGDDPETLLALLALTNSRPFGALVDLQLAAADAAARSYEVGVLQRTPVPPLTTDDRQPTTDDGRLTTEDGRPTTPAQTLATLAHRAWSLKRALDTATETSHAFLLPALLQTAGTDLAARAAAWADRVKATEAELAGIQADIDDLCFALYGIDGEDRRRIEAGFGEATKASSADDRRPTTDDELADDRRPATDDELADDQRPATDDEFASPAPLTALLVSWALGVAFGRFDLRLATGERAAPAAPGPFDPLPVCSPGMLTGADGLPLGEPPPGYPVAFPPDGILVDDPGHDRDLTGRVRQVFRQVFGAGVDALWQEAAEILDPRGRDPRGWLTGNCFAEHIRRYSKSRRKAPIYWQLATPSASYSVWLYVHRLTKDSFYQVLNDFVTPKLQHEERKLVALVQDGGANPTGGQRMEIAEQEGFVAELRAFREEVARVAPLWNPDLNDGVIINFAPLWRLVPQHRAWQKEVKECWDRLAAGDYDWAYLVMHLWPERVVPKCATDRSLAIAHGFDVGAVQILG